MPSFTRATHNTAVPKQFPTMGPQILVSMRAHAGRPDSNENFQLPPQNRKDQTYTPFDIHSNANNINPTDKMNVVLTLIGLPQRSQS